MKKSKKEFVLVGLALLALAAAALPLAGCKNDSVPEPASQQEQVWLQGQIEELEGKTEGTYPITAPSYLSVGGLIQTVKVLNDLPPDVKVELDLSAATGLTYIPNGAFIGCEALETVKLPASVTEIGGSAFDSCGSLTSVTIPASVTEIGQFAFNFCGSLTSVTIPEGVTSIGDGAFQLCGLTEVIIPSSVTEIGPYAFNNYENSLTSVTFQKKDGWYMKEWPDDDDDTAESIDVSDSSTNATNLTSGDWGYKTLIRKTES